MRTFHFRFPILFFAGGIISFLQACSPYRTIVNTTKPCGSYGLIVEQDKDSLYRLVSVDSASDAWDKGLRPGMELMAWEKLPAKKAIRQVQIQITDQPVNPELEAILQRHCINQAPGETTAQIYVGTSTGNTRGVRIATAPQPGCREFPEYLTGGVKSSEKPATLLHDSITCFRINRHLFLPHQFRHFEKRLKHPVAGRIFDLRGLITKRSNSGIPFHIPVDKPVAILVSPLTSPAIIRMVIPLRDLNNVMILSHWSINNPENNKMIQPDVRIRVNSGVRTRYLLGEDVLLEEALAHLERKIMIQRDNK